jgi:hypothetical protein
MGVKSLMGKPVYPSSKKSHTHRAKGRDGGCLCISFFLHLPPRFGGGCGTRRWRRGPVWFLFCFD